MFDALVAKPKPRRWQTAVIVGSAVAHAAVIAGIAVSAMWQVKKLEVADGVDITFNVPPPQGQTAPPPAGSLEVMKPEPPREPPKVKPDVLVQPEDAPKDPPKVTTGTTGDTTTGTGTGPGGDGTDPDADPANKQTCPTPGACIDDSKGKPPEDDKEDVVIVKKPETVRPDVAKGLRYAGNDQIHPPERVRVDMMHQGKQRLMPTVQICVDERGAVDKLRILKSSGFQAYDDKILGEMRNWKYRPYLVNGVPSPMCTVTVFQYSMTGR